MPKPVICTTCAHLMDDCCACRDCLQYRYWRPGMPECEWFEPWLPMLLPEAAAIERTLPALGIGLADEAEVGG